MSIKISSDENISSWWKRHDEYLDENVFIQSVTDVYFDSGQSSCHRLWYCYLVICFYWVKSQNLKETCQAVKEYPFPERYRLKIHLKLILNSRQVYTYCIVIIHSGDFYIDHTTVITCVESKNKWIDFWYSTQIFYCVNILGFYYFIIYCTQSIVDTSIFST